MSKAPWAQTECETCGGQARQETQRCNSCWEVERRLEQYLETTNGLKNILEAIMDAGLSTNAHGPLLVDSVKRALKEESGQQPPLESGGL